jgi:hypothetical protein
MSLWTHLKCETHDGAQVIWRWGRIGWMVVAALYVVAGMVAILVMSGSPPARLGTFAGMVACGCLHGVVAGLVLGLVALAQRLAGWGLVAPAILIPIGILVACRLGSHMLGGAIHNFVEQLGKDSPATRIFAVMARAPFLFLMFQPVVILACLLSPGLLITTLVLYYVVVVVVGSGAVVGGALSLPVLLFTTYRRLQQRARERDPRDEAPSATDPADLQFQFAE